MSLHSSWVMWTCHSFTILTMAIRRARFIVTISKLDYIIHDVVFEGFVLNCYGIFGSSSNFTYLDVIVIDENDLFTMSLILSGALVTLHGDKFGCENQVRIENFMLKPWKKFEQRDFEIYIHIISTSLVDVPQAKTSIFIMFTWTQLWIFAW